MSSIIDRNPDVEFTFENHLEVEKMMDKMIAKPCMYCDDNTTMYKSNEYRIISRYNPDDGSYNVRLYERKAMA